MLTTVDPREALDVALTGLERARKVGSTTWAPHLASNAASAALRVGDWALARSLIDTWRGHEKEADLRHRAVGIQAIMNACAGQVAEDRDLVPPQLDDMTDPQVPALLRLTDAWTALVSGRYDEAIDAALESAQHATGYAVVAFAVALRAALWAADVGARGDDRRGVRGTAMHGAAIEATRADMRGGLAWLHGREDDARNETPGRPRRVVDAGGPLRLRPSRRSTPCSPAGGTGAGSTGRWPRHAGSSKAWVPTCSWPASRRASLPGALPAAARLRAGACPPRPGQGTRPRGSARRPDRTERSGCARRARHRRVGWPRQRGRSDGRAPVGATWSA